MKARLAVTLAAVASLLGAPGVQAGGPAGLLAPSSAAAAAGATGSPPPSSAAPPSASSTPGAPSSTTASEPATGPGAPAAPTRLTRLPPRRITDGAAPFAVTLSAPVSPVSPPPSLSPAVAGSWRVVGDSEVFTPASTLSPCSGYSLVIWARTASVGHAILGRERKLSLQVACPPLTGLQLGLARLGYLGERFLPRRGVHLRPGRVSPHEAALMLFAPPSGRLVADPVGAPPLSPGRLDATTRGALEVFQADNDLAVDGEAGRPTWLALLRDLSDDRVDRTPYTWVTVSEGDPETLYLHRGDRLLLTTPVNTGVPGAETAQGIFPVYARYASTSMSGEDPDGTKYDVPDVPWVNYFNGGDAVHGYPRAAYGFPQSNGCVELPIEAARWVFGALAIGDIVWVR